MKIIGLDNLDRENVSESVLCENINEHYAKLIAEWINEREGANSSRFYVVKPDDYKPYIYEP